MIVTFTHWGFLGICPVFFAHLDDDEPFVHPVHWSVIPLLLLLTELFLWLLSSRSPLLILGELEQPRLLEGDVDD